MQSLISNAGYSNYFSTKRVWNLVINMGFLISFLSLFLLRVFFQNLNEILKTVLN